MSWKMGERSLVQVIGSWLFPIGAFVTFNYHKNEEMSRSQLLAIKETIFSPLRGPRGKPKTRKKSYERKERKKGEESKVEGQEAYFGS